MAFIIEQLSKQNNFNQKRFTRHDRGSLTAEEERRLEGSLCGKILEPTIFDEHIHFLPTPQSCSNPISWITMVGKIEASVACFHFPRARIKQYKIVFTQFIQVQDPVEMYISRYLYVR